MRSFAATFAFALVAMLLALPGLAQAGFVFCCFNNNYKITPEVFGLWIDILRDVPGSVLWLYLRHSTAQIRPMKTIATMP